MKQRCLDCQGIVSEIFKIVLIALFRARFSRIGSQERMAPIMVFSTYKIAVW